MGSLIPRSWIVDARPLPPHAIIPGLDIGGQPVSDWQQLKQLTKKQRELVLKPSGFSNIAYESKGVSIGHDLPEAKWAERLQEALDLFEYQPYILQEFHKAARRTVRYYDFYRDEVVPMRGRVMLRPYYYVIGDAPRLCGIQALVFPADKKILHGMVDAAIMPLRRVRGKLFLLIAMLSLDEKLAHLEEILRPMGQVLVGYSGGVDSATLAVAAQRVLGEGAICITADSESYATGELEKAAEITREFGIRHEVVKTRELDNPDYAKNAPNRCYYCKQELFVHMEQLASTLNIDYILYGQNADDIGDFRPGAAAARERGVHAPLAEAGLTKDDVRALAKRWGLAVWDRPAMACLSSRFPYGTPVTAEGLRQIDRAEHYLREVCGFDQVRARHHETLSRIELPAEDLTRLLDDPGCAPVFGRALSGNWLFANYCRSERLPLRQHERSFAHHRRPRCRRAAFCAGNPLLAAHSLLPAAYEQRDQMLVLRLPAKAITRLAASHLPLGPSGRTCRLRPALYRPRIGPLRRMKREIALFGAQCLRQTCTPVAAVDDAIRAHRRRPLRLHARRGRSRACRPADWCPQAGLRRRCDRPSAQLPARGLNQPQDHRRGGRASRRGGLSELSRSVR